MFAFDWYRHHCRQSQPLIVYRRYDVWLSWACVLGIVLEALKQYLVHLEKAVIVLLFFIAAKLGLNA